MDTYLDLGPNIVIPLRSAGGHRESWEPDEQIDVERTCNGLAKVLRPTHGTAYRITITASGSSVWRMPSLDGVDVGDSVVLSSSKIWTAKIPAGADQTILRRDAVPGSVSVRDPETDAIIEHAIIGKTVLIAAPADMNLIVFYRPRVVCLVIRLPVDHDESSGTGGWSLELVEEQAP